MIGELVKKMSCQYGTLEHLEKTSKKSPPQHGFWEQTKNYWMWIFLKSSIVSLNIYRK
jgi:hypothetical protein